MHRPPQRFAAAGMVALLLAAVSPLVDCGGTEEAPTNELPDAAVAPTPDAGTPPASESDAGSACGRNTTECGPLCVDTRFDPSNCGACGNTCRAGDVCANGTCALLCAGGTTRCGDRCVDTQIDDANCGACGDDAGVHVCTNDAVCTAGVCTVTCASTELACGYACIDPRTDQEHCGATAGCGVGGGTAGAACATSSCVAGVCAKIVFVTSTTHGVNLGGLAGGDAICAGRATAAGLSGTFKAWLSDEVSSPSTRFTKANQPYVRVDGVRVAASFAALVSGTLEAPIAVTELGTTVGSSPRVLTGTQTNGTPLPKLTAGSVTEDQCCDGWTSAAGAPPWAGVGNPTQKDSNWTYAYAAGINYCRDTESSRLYCVQQ